MVTAYKKAVMEAEVAGMEKISIWCEMLQHCPRLPLYSHVECFSERWIVNIFGSVNFRGMTLKFGAPCKKVVRDRSSWWIITVQRLRSASTPLYGHYVTHRSARQHENCSVKFAEKKINAKARGPPNVNLVLYILLL